MSYSSICCQHFQFVLFLTSSSRPATVRSLYSYHKRVIQSPGEWELCSCFPDAFVSLASDSYFLLERNLHPLAFCLSRLSSSHGLALQVMPLIPFYRPRFTIYQVSYPHTNHHCYLTFSSPSCCVTFPPAPSLLLYVRRFNRIFILITGKKKTQKIYPLILCF